VYLERLIPAIHQLTMLDVSQNGNSNMNQSKDRNQLTLVSGLRNGGIQGKNPSGSSVANMSFSVSTNKCIHLILLSLRF
jgi:hypothetical protein